MKLSVEAFNQAQTLLWDIREMDDMEMDTDYLRVEYNALIDYGMMAEELEGHQL